MQKSICFIISLTAILPLIAHGGKITCNNGTPLSLSQEFPLLSQYMPRSYLTRIAIQESNRPWWGKICRTEAYAGSLALEDFLYGLHQPTHQNNPTALLMQEEIHPEFFLRQQIERILGNKYSKGIHDKEYRSLVQTVAIIERGKRDQHT